MTSITKKILKYHKHTPVKHYTDLYKAFPNDNQGTLRGIFYKDIHVSKQNETNTTLDIEKQLIKIILNNKTPQQTKVSAINSLMNYKKDFEESENKGEEIYLSLYQQAKKQYQEEKKN